HKADPPAARPYHRLEMLYLAAEGWTGLGVSAFELALGGVRYTIDTLRALRRRGTEPVFVIGSDALSEIGTWRAYAQPLAQFAFAAVVRGVDAGSGPDKPWPEAVVRRLADATALGAGGPLGVGGRVVPVPMRPPAVSSSLVRERAAEGLPIDDLVPARVARY